MLAAATGSICCRAPAEVAMPSTSTMGSSAWACAVQQQIKCGRAGQGRAGQEQEKRRGQEGKRKERRGKGGLCYEQLQQESPEGSSLVPEPSLMSRWQSCMKGIYSLGSNACAH